MVVFLICIPATLAGTLKFMGSEFYSGIEEAIIDCLKELVLLLADF